MFINATDYLSRDLHWAIGIEGEFCSFELEGGDLVGDGRVNGVNLLGHHGKDVHLDAVELVEASLKYQPKCLCQMGLYGQTIQFFK